MIAAAIQLVELFLRKYFFYTLYNQHPWVFVCGYIEIFGSNIMN